MKFVNSLSLCVLLGCISSSMAVLRLSTRESNSLFAGTREMTANECGNNSLDSDCNLSFSQPIPDDSAQLSARLKDIDRVDYLKSLGDLIDTKSTTSAWYNKEPEPTLRQVLILHRHGDRTPIQFPSKDTVSNESFWTFHGYGQLTHRGKARLYLLGKMLRSRYNKFLEGSVNKQQRISRSSGSLRCIESAQTVLSSFLGLDTPDSADAARLVWDKSTNSLASLWQPASIQSVPAPFDGMLAESASCNELKSEYANVIDKSDIIKKINVEYAHEKDVLFSEMGYEMDFFFKWFWAGSQLEVERSYFAEKMKPKVLAVYDRIQEAANLAMGAYQSTLKSKRLRAGLLMNDMISHMTNYRELSRQRSVLGMLDLWKNYPIHPDYASNIIMELHEDGDEWFVKLLYMPAVPSDQIELHVTQCEAGHPLGRCTLDKFAQLMEVYRVDSWQSWMKECKNDFAKLDPYAPGS